jgi:hypothetical protein
MHQQMIPKTEHIPYSAAGGAPMDVSQGQRGLPMTDMQQQQQRGWNSMQQVAASLINYPFLLNGR